MSRICPACSHEREPAAGFVSVPDWQCPACGVAYDKAEAVKAHGSRQLLAAAYTRSHVPGLRRPSRWRLWAAAAALLACCAWGAGELAERGADIQNAAMRELAAGVQPGELRFYTSPSCGDCDQARAWLDKHHVAYSECSVRNRDCARELHALGTSAVPHFVIRGDQELSGFHLMRLVDLLKGKPAHG